MSLPSPVPSATAPPKPSTSVAVSSGSTTKTPSGASRKRKASGQLVNPGSKAARALKKCDKRVCDLVSAVPFCFVRASEK